MSREGTRAGRLGRRCERDVALARSSDELQRWEWVPRARASLKLKIPLRGGAVLVGRQDGGAYTDGAGELVSQLVEPSYSRIVSNSHWRRAVSYPEPVYLAETGEATATYRPAGNEPELVYPNGTRVHYLATGKTTRDLFGLYRMEMGAEPSGPGPHFHRSFTESFYVLAGTLRIYTGREWVETGPGAFIHVPEGGLHGFRNESGAPAALLIHFAPGAPREPYFEANARFAREGRPSDEEMAEFYREHDNLLVPEG